MKRKSALFFVLFTFLCLTAFAFILFNALGYRMNHSALLPFLVYKTTLLAQETVIERGDCILIDLSKISNIVINRGVERGYVNLREPMMKRIGAIPGDIVILKCGYLSVNGKTTKITVASHDSYGEELSAWPMPITLKTGQYWLISDSMRGFDSRYFGPVNRNVLTYKARPVF